MPWRFCSGTWNAFCWRVEGICGSAYRKTCWRDGSLSESSDFCGLAAFVKQHVELEKIGFCPGDGAVRLKFGSATARQPYLLDRWGRLNSRGAREGLSKRDGRDAALSEA